MCSSASPAATSARNEVLFRIPFQITEQVRPPSGPTRNPRRFSAPIVRVPALLNARRAPSLIHASRCARVTLNPDRHAYRNRGPVPPARGAGFRSEWFIEVVAPPRGHHTCVARRRRATRRLQRTRRESRCITVSSLPECSRCRSASLACDEPLSDMTGPTPLLEPTFSSIQEQIFENGDSSGRVACIQCHNAKGQLFAGRLNLEHAVAYDQLVNVAARNRAFGDSRRSPARRTAAIWFTSLQAGRISSACECPRTGPFSPTVRFS